MSTPDAPETAAAAPEPIAEVPPRCGLTRRRFMAGLGAAVGVVAAGAYGISVWARRDDTPATAAPGSTTTSATTSTTTMTSLPPGVLGEGSAGRTLVVVEMGGGNDSLNMVVPHQAGAYHDLRGDLAVTDPIDLDGEIGLHPALQFVAGRYQSNEVAIVEGIGYPDPDLSHFASMAVWWTGAVDATGANGWLGRYLDGVVGGDDPLAGITIGPGPSAAMLGDAAFVVSIQDFTGLAPLHAPWIDNSEELIASWAGFAPGRMDSPGLIGQVRTAIQGTVAATGSLTDALGDPEPGEPKTAARGRGSITDYLDVAGRLLTAGLAPKVIYIHGFGDFDTHEGQAGRQSALMEDLDTGLAAFFTAIEAAGLGDNVVVATTSEFGRRVAYNGSGTDHGTAATHFVLGGSVGGGRYGDPPDLGALDGRGNMIHTIDFRSYYASLLGGWLGVEAEAVLGDFYETMPLVADI